MKRTFSGVEADAAAPRVVQHQRRAAEAVERARRVHAHSILTGSSKGALIIIWKPHTTSANTLTEATLRILTSVVQRDAVDEKLSNASWEIQYSSVQPKI